MQNLLKHCISNIQTSPTTKGEKGVEFHWSLVDGGDCLLHHRRTHTRLGMGRDGSRRRGVADPVDRRTDGSEASPPPRALPLSRSRSVVAVRSTSGRCPRGSCLVRDPRAPSGGALFFDTFFAIGFNLLFVAETKLNRCARVVVCFTNQTFEVALVAPVDKLQV